MKYLSPSFSKKRRASSLHFHVEVLARVLLRVNVAVESALMTSESRSLPAVPTQVPMTSAGVSVFAGFSRGVNGLVESSGSHIREAQDSSCRFSDKFHPRSCGPLRATDLGRY